MTAADLTDDSVSETTSDVVSSVPSFSLEYNIIAEFNSAPLMVTKDYMAFSLGGSVGFGLRFNNRWSVGLKFDVDYYSLGDASFDNLSGAELAFRWMIIGASRLAEWVSLYYGVGASMSFASYGRSSQGFIKQTLVGPSLWFEPRFCIPKCRYVDFAIPIRADLRITDVLCPTVYGGGRINIHPYIQWLSLYVETGVRYTGYENEIVRSDMSQFVLSAGVTLDLFVGHKAKRKGDSSATLGMTVNESEMTGESKMTGETDEIGDKAEYNIPAENEKQEEPKVSEEQPQASSSNSLAVADMDETTKAAYQELIDHLETTTGAKVVSFSDILFAPNSDQMLEGSEAILDEVVRLLEENSSLRLNVCGYTNNVGNKKMELKTSKSRVNRVVNYLVLHGVDVFRLEVAAFGGENVKAAGINKANRRVEIRVLEDKE